MFFWTRWAALSHGCSFTPLHAFADNGRLQSYKLVTAFVPMENNHLQAEWDAVEAFMENVTTCSMDDGDCVTTCIRTHLGDDSELWNSSLCL